MDEVAAFLRAHPPFDALPEDDLLRLGRAADLLAFADGETIIAHGGGRSGPSGSCARARSSPSTRDGRSTCSRPAS